MQPSTRPILSSELILGEPLPFSVYDTDGRLLLRRGVVLTMPSQVERVVERRAVALIDSVKPAPGAGSRGAGAATPVFEQMGSLILNLKHGFTTALTKPGQIDLGARIIQLAEKIQILCQADVGGALAAPQLDHVNPYIIVHQVMGAVLTEVIARRSGVSERERLTLVCAALTRDIGMFAIQTELDSCKGPLPEPLKLVMRAHPGSSAQFLRRGGVDDPLWLNAVIGHHERLDGSGYPDALAGANIDSGGRILAIADMYSAMTKPRPYRSQEHFGQSALREIYLQKETGLDSTLIQTMIKEIGMFPPGSIVKLRNGEVGVLKRCTHALAAALTYVVYDARGMPLVEPVKRDAGANPAYEIVGMVPFSQCRSAALTIKRVWVK